MVQCGRSWGTCHGAVREMMGYVVGRARRNPSVRCNIEIRQVGWTYRGMYFVPVHSRGNERERELTRFNAVSEGESPGFLRLSAVPGNEGQFGGFGSRKSSMISIVSAFPKFHPSGVMVPVGNGNR